MAKGGWTPQRIWAEAKRRHVVKVGAAYAAAAFVALQLAEIVVPALGLPDWVLTLVVVVGAAGVPVTLLLTWVFDLTPEGVRRTLNDGHGSPFGPGRSRVTQIGAVGASVLILAGASWWTLKGRTLPAAGAPDSSIAVLPFIDLSAEGDQEYLGDGLAEEILNVLTRLEGLRVAARTSAFQFRDREIDIREVGQALSVSHVLEGSVRKDRDQIRITAQLIDVESGFHEWSNTYQRTLESVFEIQDEIARVIAEALRGTLTPTDSERLARTTEATTAPAYEAYLRGRREWNQRTPEGIEAAIAHFEEALALDPGFAKAHAGLADAWALLPLLAPGRTDADEAWARAEASASRAVALDPDLAEAHASLGLISGFRYRVERGVEQLQHAIELNPAYAPARHWRALQLSELGRHEEALTEARVARELDPLSLAIRTDLGYVHLWAGRHADAARAFGSAHELVPEHASAWFGRSLAALWSGDGAEWHSAFGRWARSVGADSAAIEDLAADILANTAGRGSASTNAVATIAELEGISSGTRATLAALAGERERVWDWLMDSVADRSYADHYPAVNPAFDGLRDDPRFQRFLEALRRS